MLARFECRGSGHGSWVDSHGDIYLGAGDPGGTGFGGVDKYIRQT